MHIDLKTSALQISQLIIELEEKVVMPEVAELTVLLSDIHLDSYTITIEFLTELVQGAEFNQLKQRINLIVLQVLESRGVGLAGKDRLFGGGH